MSQKSRDDVLVDALAGKILQLEEELAKKRGELVALEVDGRFYAKDSIQELLRQNAALKAGLNWSDGCLETVRQMIRDRESEIIRLRESQAKPAPTYSNPPMCSRCFCDAADMEGARVYGMNVDDFRDHVTKADRYGVHPSNLVSSLESRLEAVSTKLAEANRRVKALALAVRMSGSIDEAYTYLTQEERKL